MVALFNFANFSYVGHLNKITQKLRMIWGVSRDIPVNLGVSGQKNRRQK
jgi:hypothetical protein